MLEPQDQATRRLVVQAGRPRPFERVGLGDTGGAAILGEGAAVEVEGRSAAVADRRLQKFDPAPGVGRSIVPDGSGRRGDDRDRRARRVRVHLLGCALHLLPARLEFFERGVVEVTALGYESLFHRVESRGELLVGAPERGFWLDAEFA